uniref:BED-type domain-containing protein n=1 Tax=Rhabditophanes sp. KR3021 TaxID=114890 RepID=A0AC35TNF7_9BILA
MYNDPHLQATVMQGLSANEEIQARIQEQMRYSKGTNSNSYPYPDQGSQNNSNYMQPSLTLTQFGIIAKKAFSSVQEDVVVTEEGIFGLYTQRSQDSAFIFVPNQQNYYCPLGWSYTKRNFSEISKQANGIEKKTMNCKKCAALFRLEDKQHSQTISKIKIINDKLENPKDIAEYHHSSCVPTSFKDVLGFNEYLAACKHSKQLGVKPKNAYNAADARLVKLCQIFNYNIEEVRAVFGSFAGRKRTMYQGSSRSMRKHNIDDYNFDLDSVAYSDDIIPPATGNSFLNILINDSPPPPMPNRRHGGGHGEVSYSFDQLPDPTTTNYLDQIFQNDSNMELSKLICGKKRTISELNDQQSTPEITSSKRPKSKYAVHFDMTGAKAICNYCYEQVNKNGTSTMMRHLENKHSEQLAPPIGVEDVKRVDSDNVNCADKIAVYTAKGNVNINSFDNLHFSSLLQDKFVVKKAMLKRDMYSMYKNLQKKMADDLPEDWTATILGRKNDLVTYYCITFHYNDIDGTKHEGLLGCFQPTADDGPHISYEFKKVIKKLGVSLPRQIVSIYDYELVRSCELILKENVFNDYENIICSVFRLKNIVNMIAQECDLIKKVQAIGSLIIHSSKKRIRLYSNDTSKVKVKFPNEITDTKELVRAIIHHAKPLNLLGADISIADLHYLKFLLRIYEAFSKCVNVLNVESVQKIVPAYSSLVFDLNAIYYNDKVDLRDIEKHTSTLFSASDSDQEYGSDTEPEDDDFMECKNVFPVSFTNYEEPAMYLKEKLLQAINASIDDYKQHPFIQRASYLDSLTCFTRDLYDKETWIQIESDLVSEFTRLTESPNSSQINTHSSSSQRHDICHNKVDQFVIYRSTLDENKSQLLSGPLAEIKRKYLGAPASLSLNESVIKASAELPIFMKGKINSMARATLFIKING